MTTMSDNKSQLHHQHQLNNDNHDNHRNHSQSHHQRHHVHLHHKPPPPPPVLVDQTTPETSSSSSSSSSSPPRPPYPPPHAQSYALQSSVATEVSFNSPVPPVRSSIPLLANTRSTSHSTSTGSNGSFADTTIIATTAVEEEVAPVQDSTVSSVVGTAGQMEAEFTPSQSQCEKPNMAQNVIRMVKSISASHGSGSGGVASFGGNGNETQLASSLTNESSLISSSHPLMMMQSSKCPTPPEHQAQASAGVASSVPAAHRYLQTEPNSAKQMSTPQPPPNSPVVYGELVILGYNGCLPQGEKGRRRSKYQLLRRPNSNGIKKSKHYSVKQPQTSKAIQDKDQHSISFTLSRSQAIIVEYQHDDETDMFQIGRSSESPIDFVVIDTMMFDPNRIANHHHHHHNNNNNNNHHHLSRYLHNYQEQPSKVIQQSTISRFACRILIDRQYPHCARIYAAGFDSSKNIFLGEKATKWQTNGEIDGLTTNGILIMHPKKPFIGKLSGDANNNHNNGDVVKNGDQHHTGGIWREVSVCGEIYSVRETRSASQKGVRIENETNVLQDGTLIDLCGATLMWRSADGLILSPTKRHLEEMIDQLNASRPQCPVGLNTLVIPRKSASLGAADDKQPYVYLNCGHVQGYHDWGQNKHSNTRTCPMCFKTGPIVKLTMGIEPSFCTNTSQPNYCFNPCGHMASEATTRYWSQVLIPHGTNGFHAMCPFCATPLNSDAGFVKLIFQ